MKSWVRSDDESTETAPATVGVTRSGTGLGKIESKADCESKKSSVPKYDELEVVVEARTADMRGDKVGREAAAAAAVAERTTRCLIFESKRSEKQAGS